MTTEPNPPTIADLAWAEVVARYPLPQGPAVIRDLDDFTEWCRAIGGRRDAWRKAHWQDLRDAYIRIRDGIPAPPTQLTLEDA